MATPGVIMRDGRLEQVATSRGQIYSPDPDVRASSQLHRRLPIILLGASPATQVRLTDACTSNAARRTASCHPPGMPKGRPHLRAPGWRSP